MAADGERNDKSRRKKIVVSPLKRKQIQEGARRTQVPWTTAETLAVLKGYKKYLKPESSLRCLMNIFHAFLLI